MQGDAEKPNPMSLIEEVLDKKGRVFTRRYVQIDKLDQQDSDAVLNSNYNYHLVNLLKINVNGTRF